MIATITPNMSNSEHSLNTLRYADRYIYCLISRVKELKGSTTYDEDDEDYATGPDVEFEDEDMKDEEEDGLLIDDEFPPEAFTSDHQMDDDSDTPLHATPKSTISARSSLLSQVNKRPLLPRLNPDSRSSMSNSTESLDLKGLSTPSVPKHENLMDDLIKLHRTHIRESTDSGKQESKLLVNLTMKLGRTGGDRSAMQITFDTYVRELDEIIRNKMQTLEDLRLIINEHMNQ